MVRHAKQFRLFADVEMIAEILRIVFVAHFVNPCRQSDTLNFKLFQYNTAPVRAKARNTFRFHRQRAKREFLAE